VNRLIQKILLLSLLICVARTVLADDKLENYWVLASYSKEDNARTALTNMSLLAGEQLQIATFDRQGDRWYRIVQKQQGDRISKKQKFERLGMHPWTASMIGDRVVASSSAAAITVPFAADPEVLASRKTPVPQPAAIISPPEPGQSYTSYCVQKANAAERRLFCVDNKFKAAMLQETRLESMTTNEFIQFCVTEASAQERSMYCSGEYMDARISRHSS